jgi:hypothetical protein
MMHRLTPALALILISGLAFAGPAMDASGAQQATNWHAIIMFLIFVTMTMGITYWAAGRTKSTADFYTAGGGITGFQNGMAIAGDYMSAATLLGLTAMAYSAGYDAYIYMMAFFAGWPIILFLMAERLRNLGRFTFSDITSYRLDQGKVRTMAAISSLVVVVFYLIAQMVGAGQLIKLLFGLDYNVAIFAVGILMMVYVTLGGMVATTWVQIIKAGLLLFGGTLTLILAYSQFGFSLTTLLEKAEALHKLGPRLMAPGSLLADPITAISLGLGLMFGTAGLPHILMRFFTVGNAKEARKSVLYASGFVGLLLQRHLPDGPLCAIIIVGQDPRVFRGRRDRRQDHRRWQHGRHAPRQGGRRQHAARLPRSRGLRDHPGRRLGSGARGCLGDLARHLCARDPQGAGDREGRDPRFALRHHRPRNARHHPWHPVREDEHRLHGRPRLRGGGGGQLPGTHPLDVLEGSDHSRRALGRLRRRHFGGAVRALLEIGVGGRAGQSGRPLPLYATGTVRDADRLHLRLHLLED